MQTELQVKVNCFLTALFVAAVTTALTAQPLPQYSVQQRAQQLDLQKKLTTLDTKNYQQALTEARRMNRPVEQRRANGTVLLLRGISEQGELLYDATYSVVRTAQTTRTTSLYAGGSLGVSLSGSTLTDKLAQWDGGKVRSTHVEFRNGASGSRVTQVDNATTFDSHSSHVAGILMAAGVNPQVKGMAFGTNLRSYDFQSDVSEMSGAAANLLVSNHSYGSQTGWVFNDARTTATKWEWWGDTTISKTEDYKFGLYSNTARSWDQIAHSAPYYLIVKSAGNDHGENGPGDGQPYYLSTSNTISTAPRAKQDGYGQISTYGTAKNILSVGAISALSYGYNQAADVSLGNFSSWGPTDDGRIKPDIVGAGVSVLSSSSESDSAYVTYSGTSMSSPNVAGTVLLLQELFAQRNGGRFLRSSTLKGLVLHTADEAGSAPGPDYQNGWGLLNAERAGRVILNTDQNYLIDERTLNQSETYTLPVVASGRGPLVITICWNDPAGTATSALNDRTPRLVNDLDIRVSDGKATIQPWILDPANPASPASKGDNVRDNVEQVLIENPIPGKTYTLTVTHKGTLSGAKQEFGLLVSGMGGKAYCESKALSTADTKISRVQLGTINQAGSDGCTTYSDFLAVSTAVQPDQQLRLTVTLGTCGVVKNAVIKAFVDWNQNGSFDDADEIVAVSGVLSNTGQFSTTVTVPATVQNGQIVRLRIVATETDNAAGVTACGNYGNGETQDYILNVVQTVNDVGVAALVSPEVNFCGQTNTALTLTVRVHNYGSAEQTNVPVSVRITDATGADVATVTGTVPSVAAFRESQLTLKTPAGIILAPGQTYRFAITTALDSDLNRANNTLIETRTASPAPTNGLFEATRCGSDTAILLRNTGGGTAFWYDTPMGGNLLAAGNRTSVRTLPSSGQFYAVLNDFSGTIGPADKRAFGGGSYAGNFGPAPLVSTQVPLIIEQARLYIGSAGKLTFTVRKFDNTAISSVTLDVLPTRNQRLTAVNSSGQLADDPDDQGAVYTLNLRVPIPGDYKITIDYAEGATIFRSNTAVSGFPYQIKTASGSPIMTIKGALFNTSDTLKNAWYYFYGIGVRSLDCPSVQRTPVSTAPGTAATASITASGSTSICQGGSVTLQANTGNGLSYQWYRDNQAIMGAVNSTLQATTTGNYVVQVANGCLPVRSAGVGVAVRSAQAPVVTLNGLTLSSNAISNIQWLLDGLPIPGATTPNFTAVLSGRYSVKGNVNGCGEAISNEVVLTILAAEAEAPEDEILVYPNPATRQITVTVASTVPYAPTVRLADSRGITVRSAALQRDGKNRAAVLDLTGLAGGTFFVIIGDDQTQQIRVRRIQK
ncbi:MAG: peptidase [Spirosoma sp.]|nr:peptidase [Spirosoma sp.]